MAKSYDAEYRAERAENNLQTYIDLLEAKSNELKDIESKNDSLESSISSLNEALNNAKKEIFRLTSELKNESDKKILCDSSCGNSSHYYVGSSYGKCCSYHL